MTRVASGSDHRGSISAHKFNTRGRPLTILTRASAAIAEFKRGVAIILASKDIVLCTVERCRTSQDGLVYGRSCSLTVRCQGLEDEVPDTVPQAFADTDWREFRMRLIRSSPQAQPRAPEQAHDAAVEVAGDGNGGAEVAARDWAHPLHTVERGSVLLAAPHMFKQTQTYFDRAVIFLFDVGPKGSAGLILNMPTEYRICGLKQLNGAEGLAEFAQNWLYLGGDVGPTTVHVMHAFANLEEAVQIIPGVSIGGFGAARRCVREGIHGPEEFRIFNRYAGWGPGQLEREIKAGVWHSAACSPSLILREAGHEAGPRDQLWKDILRLMGGEYAQMSNGGPMPKYSSGDAEGEGSSGDKV
eukprot:jgi/Mesvir1/20353/Mv19939-RA.1